MKSLALFMLFAAVLNLTAAQGIHTNGKPCCKTPEEVGKNFRNFWDPTRYWYCKALNEPVSIRCPDQTGYMASLDRCVPWIDWVWETPIPPPNCPYAIDEQSVDYNEPMIH